MRRGMVYGVILPVLYVTFLACSTAGSAPTKQSKTPSALPMAARIEGQPLLSQVQRLRETLAFLGEPLPARVQEELSAVESETDDARITQRVQRALDPYCLAGIRISSGKPIEVTANPGRAPLFEQGWRPFLVKVVNEAGATAPLQVRSPNASPLPDSPAADVKNRWLGLETFDRPPLLPALSGLGLEYRIVSLYSREEGTRPAVLEFQVKRDEPSGAAWASLPFSLNTAGSVPVKLRVRDEKDHPTTACFLIRDQKGRVFPPQAKRLAPDFHFQPQVYRRDGETLRLPAGAYTIVCSRGPESLPETKTLTVGTSPTTFAYKVKRWIDPSTLGWWSGDHHIHAAGCAHYTNPTEGVLASDMQRHIEGEDLKVGCNLTWGPCFDYQKQFFTGGIAATSSYPYLLRYDIEVSGFGSHQAGHLCLLRLHDQMYPGGTSKNHWPTLCLNTLRWAKKQGAVCGPAHSANGLAGSVGRVADQDGPGGLPSYAIPRFDGIGAMEYIADVTHELPGPDGKLVPAVDFLSTMDTARKEELNIWYHTLNCGFRTRISGETDFPCITGERVGKGRSYVKLDGKLDFDAWCEGIRTGRCYVSDGLSHLPEFRLNGIGVGEKGSEVRLDKPGEVAVTVKAASQLLGDASQGAGSVSVEVIVNGYPVARQALPTDGVLRDLKFTVPMTQSCWVAVRVLGSAHTNPIFVVVEGKPLRAGRRSAMWCLRSVEQCWSQKERFYSAAEKAEAKAVYDHARETYRRMVAEAVAD